MKRIFSTLIIVFSASICFASVSPVKIINYKVAPTCTVTAYGEYREPNGTFTNVQCTQSGASCAEATDKANDCRNQNICVRVRCNGLTPAASLGCKITSICDVIE